MIVGEVAAGASTDGLAAGKLGLLLKSVNGKLVNGMLL
jgi:hypothetical protein